MGIFDNLSGIDAPDLGGFAPTERELVGRGTHLDARNLSILEACGTYEEIDTERECKDATQIGTAVEAIGRLPTATEARHLIIGGTFALLDCLPAVLELAEGATVVDLAIATLGFSKRNVAKLAELIDAGKVGRLALLCSHYFAGTSKSEYQHAQNELVEARGQRVYHLRTHAKILAMKLTDGRAVTIESSANLRSCKNIEQLTLYGAPALFDFHSTWIKGLAPNGT